MRIYQNVGNLSVCSGSVVVTAYDFESRRWVRVLSEGQYTIRLWSLNRAYPSFHPSGIVHWVPEQLNIKAVNEACNLIDGCHLELCSATVSLVSSGICHRNKVNTRRRISWIFFKRRSPMFGPAPVGMPGQRRQSGPIHSLDSRRYQMMMCAMKSCSLDPVPIITLKEVLDVLLPYLTHMCNTLLSGGPLPVSQWHAIITPLLKKSSLDPAELKNYWPVSNLTFMSKIVEKLISGELGYLQSNNLMPHFQSAYCRHHSTVVLGEILLGVRPVLARMPEIPCVFWGHGR